jgi:hypothetical protein
MDGAEVADNKVVEELESLRIDYFIIVRLVILS